MTPADLRALAARVMAGEVDGINVLIWDAVVGLTEHEERHCQTWCNMSGRTDLKRSMFLKVWAPDYLHSLDAADALFAPLRERGWKISIRQRPGLRWQANGVYHPDGIECFAIAPTERAARVAMALLCLAAEGEATPLHPADTVLRGRDPVRRPPMSEIELNEVALAAAHVAFRDGWYGDNKTLHESTETAIRAYLTADPDRAARDAVVKAATMLVTANAKANRTMTPTAEMAYERAGITLDAAVAALPKEPPHE